MPPDAWAPRFRSAATGLTSSRVRVPLDRHEDQADEQPAHAQNSLGPVGQGALGDREPES